MQRIQRYKIGKRSRSRMHFSLFINRSSARDSARTAVCSMFLAVPRIFNGILWGM